MTEKLIDQNPLLEVYPTATRDQAAPLIPYAATIEAMREARRGELPPFDSVEELLHDLQAED